MKKEITWILCAILLAACLGVSACGDSEEDGDTMAQPVMEEPEVVQPEPEEPSVQEPEGEPSVEEPEVGEPEGAEPEMMSDEYPGDCDEADFFPLPLRGPGFNDEGDWIEPPDVSYVVSTTWIKPKSGSEARFGELVGSVVAELQRSEGFLGYSLGNSVSCGSARTLTLWRSEEAMMGFVLSDAHLQAIQSTSEVGDRAATFAWSVPGEEMPMDWERAKEAISQVEPTY